MGLTIACEKTHSSIEIGYVGFFILREKIFELASANKGIPELKHNHSVGLCSLQKDWEDDANMLQSVGAITDRVANFLLASDCGGSACHKTCHDLVDIIGDFDDGGLYGWRLCGCERKNVGIQDFKLLLQECVDNKCKMVWF